ncbi:hypothetical protein CBR_g55463 [Chara braunii]|uniref:CCHC-type domain-containing protein n=1 Tax=Chara braunii TaxID=69332 RepID=A0A388K7X0_CHABU|nr:hypothetical protein CBR_g55463 [Chara braunii]|eukprot:GBG66119.1 hypothetical protein CBR_g55463 [Chara braunii]
MSGSGYRDNRDYRRSSERDRTYDDGRYGGRDAACKRGRDGRRNRYPEDERSTGYREGVTRPQVTCFECGEPGHYRNQCPTLIGESSTQRGRSASPGYVARGVVKRPSSEEPALRKQLEVLTSTMASMKSFIDAEQARKDKEERQRKESKKREQEKAEQLRRETEEQLVRERRARKKEDKKKKEAEDRAALRKELRMDMRLHMGAMCEGVHDRIIQTMLSEGKKGKAKTTEYNSDYSDGDSDDSEVQALSEQTERLMISEKRKRGEEECGGDSPPIVTPTKRFTKRGVLDPKKLLLSVRHQPLKKPSPKRMTPASLPPPLSKRKKIPASPGLKGKLCYVQDNLRNLGSFNKDELKTICRVEDVAFEGKKMDIILAITEKQAHVAYGTDAESDDKTTAEVLAQENLPEGNSDEDKGSEL